MAASLLELTRATHEDLDRYQRALVTELDYQAKNFRDSVIQSNRVSKYLERIEDTSEKLANIYEDKDGIRKEELGSLAGAGPALYSMFYERLREVRDYHRKFPAQIEDPDNHIFIDDYEALPPFTGEEGYGKCLDLNDFYERFLNLKMNEDKLQSARTPVAPPTKSKFSSSATPKPTRFDYIRYLYSFFNFDDEKNQFKNEEYRKYLVDLLSYLKGFLQRSQPLFEWSKTFQDLEKEVTERWTSGAFSGWTVIAPDPDDNVQPQATNNNGNSSLTDILSKLDIGGQKPDSSVFICKICTQEFSKESVFKGHLQSKKHKERVDKLVHTQKELLKQCYILEMQINEIVNQYLLEQIDNSKANIEKRQARTARERELEAWDYDEDGMPLVEIVEEEDEDEPEEIKMTIDNYPVGWDGKPIPYWLYKLHGLGVEYKCEICGNTSYWGRKAYEKHFQEWRHAHGMRCLGIPNSKHFHDITKINDAIALWEKIKKDSTLDLWKPEDAEEYEDREGNVYNKKIYEDLKRQELI